MGVSFTAKLLEHILPNYPGFFFKLSNALNCSLSLYPLLSCQLKAYAKIGRLVYNKVSCTHHMNFIFLFMDFFISTYIYIIHLLSCALFERNLRHYIISCTNIYKYISKEKDFFKI